MSRRSPLRYQDIDSNLATVKRTALSPINLASYHRFQHTQDPCIQTKLLPTSFVPAVLMTKKAHDSFKVLDHSGYSAKPFVELSNNLSEKYSKSFDPKIVKLTSNTKNFYKSNSRGISKRISGRFPTIQPIEGVSYNKSEKSALSVLDEIIKSRSSISVTKFDLELKVKQTSYEAFRNSFLSEIEKLKIEKKMLITNSLKRLPKRIEVENGDAIVNNVSKTTVHADFKENSVREVTRIKRSKKSVNNTNSFFKEIVKDESRSHSIAPLDSKSQKRVIKASKLNRRSILDG